MPREAPLVAAALRAGIRVIGELELGWRLLDARVHRAHRLQRQDDDGRADRARPPQRRAARRRRRQRRHGADVAARHARAGRGRRLRGLVVPARGHARRSRPRPRCCSTWPRTTWTATAPSRPTARRSSRSSPTSRREAVAGRAALGRWRRGDAYVRRRGRRALSVRRRRGAGPRHRDGTLYWRGEPLMAAADIRLRGAHNRENAMAAAAVCLARGRRPGGGARGRWRRSPASPHRLEEIGDGRRRHLRQRLEGHQRRLGRGRHPLVRGRRAPDRRRPREGLGLRAARGAGQERCDGRLPDRRDRRRAARRAGDRPASRSHDAHDLERAFAQRTRRPRAAATSCCSRPGCASYDQYRSYEERGDHFRDARERDCDKAGRRPAPSCRMAVRWAETAAAARAPTAADRHLLPAGGRGGDGLLGVVGPDAAAGPGRRHGVPDQVRRLRGARADRRCTSSRG